MKNWIAEEEVQSAKLNQTGVPFIGASAVGTDAYAVNPALAVIAYVDGMPFCFDADVANVGACTFNLSALGAKNIKLANGNDPNDGDIPAGYRARLRYDGTDMILENPYPLVGQVDASQLHFHNKTFGAVTGNGNVTQAIAHGLGVVPKRIKITAKEAHGTTGQSQSTGIFDGISYATVHSNGNGTAGFSTTVIITTYRDNTTTTLTATVVIDATNITLTWDNAANTLTRLLWEAEA